MGKYLEEGTEACKLVVLSDRAYRSIVAEACSHIKTETGGIFLGRKINGVWFVVESVDPGLEVTMRPDLFSYDADYVNHLISKISILYDYNLEVLGIWHRHPGSMDFFSGIDDRAHDALVHHDVGEPIISMLVNFDPKFRITMYYVDDKVNYRKIDAIYGDDQMIPEFLKLVAVDDLFERFSLPGGISKENYGWIEGGSSNNILGFSVSRKTNNTVVTEKTDLENVENDKIKDDKGPIDQVDEQSNNGISNPVEESSAVQEGAEVKEKTSRFSGLLIFRKNKKGQDE